MKKIFVLLLIAVIGVVFALPQNVEAADEAPIEIRTVSDLMAIENNPSGSYILMNDIDLSETKKGGELDTGHGWTPIPSFSGTLDGNGYRIMNLTMYGNIGSYIDGDYTFGCLFKSVNGTVKNLGLTNLNVDISSGGRGEEFGVICGWLSGDVDSCYVTGDIILSGFSNVGSIAGDSDGSWIENCINTADITNSYKGGWFHGLAEYADKSYNIGTLVGSDVNGADSGGYSHKNYYLNTSVPEGTSENSSSKSLTDAMMKSQGSFVGFDFDNVWGIDPYCSYKYPQLKNNRIVRLDSLTLTAPTKTVYFQGDKLDLSNAKVKLSYEDDVNSTIPLTESLLSGYDMNRIGRQTVTVSYGGKTQSFDIEVKEIPVESISITNSLSIYRPNSMQIAATILPERASDKTITWTSTDNSIATVSQDGMVRAKNPGTVTITAVTNNGKKATCQVTVMVACSSLILDKQSAVLQIGDTADINASVLPLECTEEIKWRSSDESIVQVSGGKITALSGGVAIVTAYTDSGVEAQFNVAVEIPISSIAIKDSLNLYSAKSEKLVVTFSPAIVSNKSLTWSSSDPNVASVSADGTVRGKNAGTATITATTVNGKTASCKVTVLVACVSLKMNKESCTLKVGDISELKVSKSPASSSDNVKWKTSNSNIVDVEDGEIYGISEGKATITAYTDRGVTATCVVTVTDTAKAIKQTKATKAKIKSIKNASGKKIKLSLSGKSKCDGYEIQYALKKSFRGKKVLKKTGSSVTISKLKKSKNYFVRVRAYKKIEGTIYYGAWSEAKKIKIKK